MEENEFQVLSKGNTYTNAFEAKPELFRKENSPPLSTHPVDMLTCPLQTFLPMAWHEQDANGWSSSIKTPFVKPSTQYWP
ncbi:hypothetical protein TNCV_1828761 [Trichonephila clavipes]|nr:hypothetical protein TNCV_1828761 [Trichonephila clavipes]